MRTFLEFTDIEENIRNVLENPDYLSWMGLCDSYEENSEIEVSKKIRECLGNKMSSESFLEDGKIDDRVRAAMAKRYMYRLCGKGKGEWIYQDDEVLNKFLIDLINHNFKFEIPTKYADLHYYAPLTSVLELLCTKFREGLKNATAAVESVKKQIM